MNGADRRFKLFITNPENRVVTFPSRAGIRAIGMFLQSVADTDTPIDTTIDGARIILTPMVKCGAPRCGLMCEAIPATTWEAPVPYCSDACRRLVEEETLRELTKQVGAKGSKP